MSAVVTAEIHLRGGVTVEYLTDRVETTRSGMFGGPTDNVATFADMGVWARITVASGWVRQTWETADPTVLALGPEVMAQRCMRNPPANTTVLPRPIAKSESR